MTRHLDPDRRRPAPPHPGFKERQIDVDMDVCKWCGALVPADEREKTKHEDWEQRIAARFLSLFDALNLTSGSVTGPPPTPTGPDPNRPQGPTASEVPHD